MAREIARRLIGGIWRTVDADEASSGGGGSGIDFVQVEDPGAVGTGKLWLQLPGLISPDAWQAETEYLGSQRVQPTTPNGHFYSSVGPAPGTSDVTEPDPWPTDGSAVADNDISWQDAGLLETFQVTSLQLWYRNDADDGWLAIGIADRMGNNQSNGITMFDPSGVVRAQFNINQDFGGYITFWSNDEGGNNLAETYIEPTQSAVGGGSGGEFFRDSATGLLSLPAVPTVDPMDGVSLWIDPSGFVKVASTP